MAERALKPEKLDIEANDPDGNKKFKHWFRCLESLIRCLDSPEKPVNKLDLLVQSVSFTIYESIEEAKTYDEAITTLKALFLKDTNILIARNKLYTRRQKDGEEIKDYLDELYKLANRCEFAAVTAEKHKEESIRDTFVAGLRNLDTKRKILESPDTDLKSIGTLAQIYEDARHNAESFVKYFQSKNFLVGGSVTI